SKVALIGNDLAGMKPSMEVKVGDQVQIGQLLFSDKKQVGVCYTSPAAGEVIEINRGARRAFESIVIKVQGDDHVNFENYRGGDLGQYNQEELKKLLLEAGLWPSLR